MSEEEKSKLILYVSLMIIFVSVGSVLFVINYFTVEMAVVDASCEIILNNILEIPDNVITKGYDIVTENGTSREKCYYIKNAGIIERIYYGWSLYQI